MFPLAFAWLAAAAFAASLGYFLYAYLVLFGDPPSRRGVLFGYSAAAAAGWNLMLFTIFALHHSLFARTRIKRLVRTWLPASLERAVYSLVASALFVLVCLWWQPLSGHAWQLSGSWQLLGYSAQAAGIIVTIAGARALDVLDLAGVRQVLPASCGERPLKSDGVYGLVRHPLYFGWALLVFGAPEMTWTRLVFAVISAGYLMIAIPFEERGLVDTFGKEYAAYQRKVRWRMLPGLY